MADRCHALRSAQICGLIHFLLAGPPAALGRMCVLLMLCPHKVGSKKNWRALKWSRSRESKDGENPLMGLNDWSHSIIVKQVLCASIANGHDPCSSSTAHHESKKWMQSANHDVQKTWHDQQLAYNIWQVASYPRHSWFFASSPPCSFASALLEPSMDGFIRMRRYHGALVGITAEVHILD